MEAIRSKTQVLGDVSIYSRTLLRTARLTPLHLHRPISRSTSFLDFSLSIPPVTSLSPTFELVDRPSVTLPFSSSTSW